MKSFYTAHQDQIGDYLVYEGLAGFSEDGAAWACEDHEKMAPYKYRKVIAFCHTHNDPERDIQWSIAPPGIPLEQAIQNERESRG